MPQRVVLQTEAGPLEYMGFVDNTELGLAYRNKEIAIGAQIVYRTNVCEIIGEYEDGDGFVWPLLLVVTMEV